MCVTGKKITVVTHIMINSGDILVLNKIIGLDTILSGQT